MYAKAAKANIAIYEKKTTRQKYAKQEAYTQFRSSIWVKPLPTATFAFRKLKTCDAGIPTPWHPNAPDHGANPSRCVRSIQNLDNQPHLKRFLSHPRTRGQQR